MLLVINASCCVPLRFGIGCFAALGNLHDNKVRLSQKKSYLNIRKINGYNSLYEQSKGNNVIISVGIEYGI